jgi:hypothetical protein
VTHLLHTTFPEGTVLEVVPNKVEIGRGEKTEGDTETPYTIILHDHGFVVRFVMAEPDFRELVTSAAAQFQDEDEDETAKPVLTVARTMPNRRVL